MAWLSDMLMAHRGKGPQRRRRYEMATPDRWLGESAGDLPICPACEEEVTEPEPEAVWPRVLYHAECVDPEGVEG
jgi:hypothetical protein